MRSVAFVVVVVALGCGTADDRREGGHHDVVGAECAFTSAPFSPSATIVEGVSDDGDACAILEREPVTSRRDTEWRALSLFVRIGDRALAGAGDAVSYENTHHNCRDVARIEHAALTIDGVTDDDASACFDPASSAWLLRLAVDGVETVLRPRH
jgi:hypothetical protein